MTRLHKSFGNINRNITAAANRLFDSKPWQRDRFSGVPKTDKAQRFVDTFVRTYDLPPLLVQFSNEGSYSYESHDEGSPEYDFNFVGDSISEAPSRIGIVKIPRRGWNTIAFFLSVRDHHVFGGEYETDDDKMKDREGWAYSLLYTVRPTLFRSLARDGQLPHVKAIDTFTTETAEAMIELGLLDEDGNLTIPVRRLDMDDLIGSARFVGTTSSYVSEDEEDHEEPATDYHDPSESDPLLFGDDDDEDEVEVASEPVSEGDGSVGGLESLGIVALRKLSRGKFSGGYSMDKQTLIDALRQAGVR